MDGWIIGRMNNVKMEGTLTQAYLNLYTYDKVLLCKLSVSYSVVNVLYCLIVES